MTIHIIVQQDQGMLILFTKGEFLLYLHLRLMLLSQYPYPFTALFLQTIWKWTLSVHVYHKYHIVVETLVVP